MQQQKCKTEDRDGCSHDGHGNGDIQRFDDKRLLHSESHTFLWLEITNTLSFSRVVFQTGLFFDSIPDFSFFFAYFLQTGMKKGDL